MISHLITALTIVGAFGFVVSMFAALVVMSRD